MLHRLSILALAASFLLPTLAQAQDPESSVRWFDLRSLESAALQPMRDVDLRMHLISSRLESFEPDSYDIDLEDFPQISGETISQILLDALGDTWTDPTLFLEAEGGFLRVEGNAASQAAIEGLLTNLSQAILQTVHMELFLLPGDAVPASMPPLLTAQAAADLLAANPGHVVASQHSPLGQRLMLGSESMRSALYDYDVEVAQFAQVPDPTITVQRAGTRFGAVVRACPGGQLFVRAWGRNGEPTKVLGTVKIDALAGATVQLPSGNSNVVLSSATLVSGGAMLLGQSGQGSKLWLLRVTRDQPVPTGAGTWLPLGALTAPAILRDTPTLSHADPSGGMVIPQGRLAAQLENNDALELEPEHILEKLWDVQGVHQLPGTLLLVGHNLWIHGSDELVAEARKMLDGMQRAYVGPSMEFEVRYELLDADQAATLLAQSDPAALLEHLPRKVRLTARAGDSAFLTDGVERSYLKDIDVEIAQGASIGDPIFGELFAGVSLWCRATPNIDGSLCSWIELVVHRDGNSGSIQTASWEPVVTDEKPGAQTPNGSFKLDTSLELPNTLRAGIQARVNAASGAWSMLGVSRLGGTERLLVAIVRTTAR